MKQYSCVQYYSSIGMSDTAFFVINIKKMAFYNMKKYKKTGIDPSPFKQGILKMNKFELLWMSDTNIQQ